MRNDSLPPIALGWPAAQFDLPGIDGSRHSLASARGRNGLVVMFICNHCPYVKAAIGRIVRDADALASVGIGSIAIMSNDVVAYPADSFDNMKAFAAAHDIRFPYVIDESQEVARAYDAICTPDFFGFDTDLTLAYRGRLDAAGRSTDTSAKRELYDAMAQVARTGRAPLEQHPSIGCAIKWRAPASSQERA
ncbi:MAG TPA: thioredoxin family protein [Casimicrobiaceae bacterium]|nr:thioredoxin family protein [Casimicrobiaceae bacterium]